MVTLWLQIETYHRLLYSIRNLRSDEIQQFIGGELHHDPPYTP